MERSSITIWPSNAQKVTLEVLDRDGKVLRTYSSKDPVTPTPEQMKTNLIPPYWPLVHGPLPVNAGHASVGLGFALDQAHRHPL